MFKYPWYKIVNKTEPVLQGDFVNSCPIIVYKTIKDLKKLGKLSSEVVEYDVVVMSQSCDLVNKNIDLVLVCPVWPLSVFGESNNLFKSDNGKEQLRKGRVLGYHLLNKCELKGFVKDYAVVDFRNVYSVPFDFIIDFAKSKRLRLLPPYREHLSQTFARFFMRVGLPIDIPSFKKK